jgi:putative SOS response-associated peptidase YedK
VCAPIHTRMPVILDPAAYARWLGDETKERDGLIGMLKPYPAARMTANKVGPAVGNVRNHDPSIAERIEA